MAKNSEVFFQGKASWPKLVVPDREYKNWNVKVHLTPESYNKFMDLKETKGETEGILNEVKKDEDGYFVVFKRPTEKTWKGKLEKLLPPILLDAEGRPMNTDIGIGNGSDVTVKCEYYTYNKPFGRKGRGSAIRMIAVRVDNLVPYSRGDFDESKEKAVAGLDDQPRQALF